MNISAYLILGFMCALIIFAAWSTIRSLARESPRRPRSILQACGLVFVAVSAALFVLMELDFARTPGVAGNSELVLTTYCRYACFNPDTLALLGASLAVTGIGIARWALALVGVAMWFLWVQFGASLF
jgi:hypothetical protein